MESAVSLNNKKRPCPAVLLLGSSGVGTKQAASDGGRRLGCTKPPLPGLLGTVDRVAQFVDGRFVRFAGPDGTDYCQHS